MIYEIQPSIITTVSVLEIVKMNVSLMFLLIRKEGRLLFLQYGHELRINLLFQ